MTLDELIEAGQATTTAEHAFQILGLSKNAGWRALHRHEIPHLKFGGRYRVPVRQLAEMLGYADDSSVGTDDPSPPANESTPAPAQATGAESSAITRPGGERKARVIRVPS